MARLRLLRQSLALAASQYLARAILIARGIVAAGALGPHGFGGWNALNLIYDYATWATLGALQGLDLELPAAARAERRERARALMSGAWTVVVAGSAVYGVGVLLYVLAGGGSLVAVHGRRLPLFMFAAAALQLAFLYLASCLRAHDRVSAVSAGHALQAVVGGGIGLALVWGSGAWGLVWGWIAGTLVALVVMWRAVPEAPLLPGRPAVAAGLVRAGMPIFVFFGLTVALRSVDRLALLRFAGEEPLGLYAIGLVAFGVILYLAEAVAYVLFPRLAAAFQGAYDPSAAVGEAVRAQRGLVVLVPLLVGLGMVAAGPVLVALLPDYTAALPSVRMLAIGAAVFSAATVPGYYLLAARRFRALLTIVTAATVVQAALVAAAALRTADPAAVAAAATAGFALYALAVLLVTARAWHAEGAARVREVAAGLAPAACGGALALAACSVGSDASWAHALLRGAAVTAGYVPVVLGFGRGTGIATLLREALARRAAR